MKSIKSIFAGTATVFAMTWAASWADEGHDTDGWNSGRVDAHAPIGVMGDHMHGAGEWMTSYRYMNMEMEGNLSGTRRATTQEVLEQYRVTPLDMSMERHMVGVMYAPSDKLTLVTMLPYVEKSMTHLTRMGGRFTTEASGIGDVTIGGLYQLWQTDGHRLHLNALLGLPTGEIDEQDQTPAGRAQLPYPMQLGSGTYDLMPGLTYLGQASQRSWGAQAVGTFRLDENDNDYTLGDRYDLSLWGAMVTCKNSSLSLRLQHTHWQDVEGADPALNPMVVPTADPNLRGGDRTDLGVGVNLLGTDGFSKGHRLGAEILWPIRQDLDGPQLETDLRFVLGWQKAW